MAISGSTVMVVCMWLFSGAFLLWLAWDTRRRKAARKHRAGWRWAVALEMAGHNLPQADGLVRECDEAHLPGDCPLCGRDGATAEGDRT